MDLNIRIEAFSTLGEIINDFVQGKVGNFSDKMNSALARTGNVNSWFTRENILQSLSSISDMLEREKLHTWISEYEDDLKIEKTPGRVGVIMAGNIPVVGFHDFLCVLISGNAVIGKLASSDPFLLPVIAAELVEIEPRFSGRIEFVQKLTVFDAVIATGSNNSARYFDYYFGKYPHIIRKNRNSVAVLTGEETDEQLGLLGKDIFDYYGLGCRNVSKLYVPENYDFNSFWNSIFPFADVMKHNKYANNYDYNRAILLLEQIPFLTNEFLILKEDPALATPVAVVNYEKLNEEKIKKVLSEGKEAIQCIVSSADFIENKVEFGQTQYPQLGDYADKVDTIKFLIGLK
ncbi:MAG: acyl-CoA reductase [Bacteroidia bacterium]